MVHPVSAIDTKAFNIASKYGYSPYFDIVWSFEYAICGNVNTEAGFTVFLMEDIPFLSGGNGSIDLGYSGISPLSAVYNSSSQGISGGILAVGFDTKGIFATTASYDVYGNINRDGISNIDKIPNSIALRAEAPDYSFNKYAFNIPISSVNTNFKIVEADISYKTIRARLGNVGRTLYIDYRNTPEEDFKLLLQKDVDLNIVSSTKYKVGASFATGFGGIKADIGVIYFKNFHTEGNLNAGNIGYYNLQEPVTQLTDVNIVPASYPELTTLPIIPNYVVNTQSSLNNYIGISQLPSYGRLSSVDSCSVFTEDLFNFGYTVSLSSTGNANIGILTRKDVFTYLDDISGQFILNKETACDRWILSSVYIDNVNTTALSSIGYTPTGVYEGLFLGNTLTVLNT
jgi:hypothetical protein